MVAAILLPAAMGQHAHAWRNRKQPLFIGLMSWMQGRAARPTISSQSLSVSTYEQRVRCERPDRKVAADLSKQLANGYRIQVWQLFRQLERDIDFQHREVGFAFSSDARRRVTFFENLLHY